MKLNLKMDLGGGWLKKKLDFVVRIFYLGIHEND